MTNGIVIKADLMAYRKKRDIRWRSLLMGNSCGVLAVAVLLDC
jgi:hypothetical protein